jgi:hypothetical protein
MQAKHKPALATTIQVQGNYTIGTSGPIGHALSIVYDLTPNTNFTLNVPPPARLRRISSSSNGSSILSSCEPIASHGPVVDVLLDRGFIVHAINPKQLDRLRDRFSVAVAKDDRRDAYVSADGLRTDRHLFRRLQSADPRLIELRAWSRLAEELKEERVRLSNRFHQQLWRYYPQMLQLTDDLTATWFLDLWLRAPTPAKAARLRKSAVAQLLKQHRSAA